MKIWGSVQMMDIVDNFLCYKIYVIDMLFLDRSTLMSYHRIIKSNHEPCIQRIQAMRELLADAGAAVVSAGSAAKRMNFIIK